MSWFKKSISRRFTTLVFFVLLFASLLLSVSSYYISVGIINNYVMPQIDKVLTSSVQDVYKGLNMTHAQQTRNQSEQAISTIGFYLEDKRELHHLETLFLAEVKEDGTAVVLATDRGSKLKLQETMEQQPAMQQALKGKSGLSDMYSDAHGMHKTAYVGISGSPIVLGVSADTAFVQDKMSSLFWTSSGITLLALLLGMGAAWMLARRIVRPIKQLVVYSNRLADGDFTQDIEIKGKDETALLAESFRSMKLRLQEMIGQVLHTSEAVVGDAHNLRSRVHSMNGMTRRSTESVQHIAAGSTTIATSAMDNARAMEEIASGIQHIASSAGEVTERIHEASEEADSGNSLAQHAVRQMSQVEQASVESLKQFRQIEEQSQQVGKVVEEINVITKQIQMLSLNASIEAARAGEHGRGFAVVAGEVRKLSEQSHTANEQISKFLFGLQENMKNSVAEIEQVNEEITSGAGTVKQAGEAFSHLRSLIQTINQSIQSVSAATQEISAGTEEVSASVEETAQITAKSQAGAQVLSENYARQLAELEEHASTVEHLHGQAEKLQQAASRFKI
ncbi:methyl-accepting chemotaxis protein [Paenibacillus sp. CN-4]|uniref:methyl-accepting chemotaxis protein n=1 Tax=Paenibacillus nanchangensis TaxID=3348343 RepID=UPI00397C860A